MGRILLTAASYSARSLLASAQRSVNLYPEINPADASAPATFYGTPGRLLWSTLPVGPVRLLYQASNGGLYAVGGANLYRYVASAWVLLASMGSSSGPVYAADNGISAVFVDGSTVAPTVNLSAHVTSVMSGAGWYGADFVDFLDGFFIFNKPGTQQFYITGAYDLTVDALDFASAESVPDVIVRVIKDHGEIWFFGPRSIEMFGTGGGIFPFERLSGSTMETGCAAAHSVCKLDNTLVWLGSDERGDAMVWRAQGQQPARISTHALEEEMRQYATISDAQGYSYQQGGHSFYVLTFPAAGKTWVYDASTQLWHERAWRDGSNNLGRVRDNCHVFYQRKHLVGDWQTGEIFELDLDTYTDNGAPIARIKSFQHIVSDGVRQFFRSLTLDMEAGAGSVAEPDPQVMLRWSDDGGFTWTGVISRSCSMGQIGEYKAKPKFNRLGMGRDRVFEVSTTANAKVALQGAFLEVTAGTS